MKIIKFTFFLIIITLGFITGCSTSSYHRGKEALKVHAIDDAYLHLQSAYLNDPKNPFINRELGIASFLKRQYEAAITHFVTAQRKLPKDGRLLFYLGVSYELQNQKEDAIKIYSQYLKISRLKPIRRAIEKRLLNLVRITAEEQAKHALVNEQQLNIQAIPEHSVAVINFAYLGRDSSLTPLEKGLAYFVITDLSKISRLQLVERLKIQEILAELKLSQQAIMDKQTAPRLGKLLGAAQIIQGAFLDVAEKQVRMDASIAALASRETRMTDAISGSLANIIRLEKELVFKILNTMKIPLTERERTEIMILPTEKVLAFMAFCRGLDFEDRGAWQQALNEYFFAVKYDPDFVLAKQKSQECELNLGESESTEDMVQLYETLSQQATLLGEARTSRLRTSSGIIEGGFVPGQDERKAVEETFGEPPLGDINVQVTVPLPPK
jgi:tetratricopeptide (TPR) repeat protein